MENQWVNFVDNMKGERRESEGRAKEERRKNGEITENERKKILQNGLFREKSLPLYFERVYNRPQNFIFNLIYRI